jgi:diguanylate cyclase (GGDEF)-like protein
MEMNSTDNAVNLDHLKRKIYQTTLFIATLVLLFVWGLSIRNGTLGQGESFLFPFFSLFCAGSLIIFKIKGVRYLMLFEKIALGLAFLYFLTHFTLEIRIGLSEPALDYRKFLLWIPVLYVFSFLMFPAKQAIRWSLFYIVCIIIVGIFYCFKKSGADGLGNDVMLLAQIYGSGVLYISLLYAIAKLKEKYLEAEIRSDMMSTLANTDMLTGAFSRAKIEEYLDRHINIHDKPPSVMMLDLDKLKYINDTYGHNAGDYVLKRTVQILRANLRDSDWLGRIGGDEFLLVCPSTDQTSAKGLAQRLENAITDAKFEFIGHLSISIGVATYHEDDTPRELIDRADTEMYAHKKNKVHAKEDQ